MIGGGVISITLLLEASCIRARYRSVYMNYIRLCIVLTQATVNYCQLLAAAAVTAHTATPPPLAHSPSHGIKLCQGEASLRLQRISGVLPAVNCSDAAVWLGGAVTGS